MNAVGEIRNLSPEENAQITAVREELRQFLVGRLEQGLSLKVLLSALGSTVVEIIKREAGMGCVPVWFAKMARMTAAQVDLAAARLAFEARLHSKTRH